MSTVQIGAVGLGAVTIMLLVSGIALGLGYALNDKRLKLFGMDELKQSAANGALVGAFVLTAFGTSALAGAANQVVNSTGVNASCTGTQGLLNDEAVCVANSYLGHVSSSVIDAITGLYVANGALGVVSGIRFGIDIISFSPSAIVAPAISQIQYAIKGLTTVEISLLVQSALLTLLPEVVSILLPVGIVLRCFYPSRKLGGFITATALGLYLVLPLSYVLDASMLGSELSSLNFSAVTQLESGVSGMSAAMTSFSGLLGSGLSGSYNFTLNYTYISNAFEDPLTLIAGLMSALFDLLSLLIVYVFILPAFNLIITGLSIRELSRLLGSDATFGLMDLL